MKQLTKNIFPLRYIFSVLKPQPYLSKLYKNQIITQVHVIPIQQLLQPQPFYPHLKQVFTNKITIITNNHFSTLQSPQIIKKINLHIQSHQTHFIPHFFSVVKDFKANKSQEKVKHGNGLKLLIGDGNPHMLAYFQSNSYITLEEICMLYPEKVPLSYRKKDNIHQQRNKIETRINKNRQNKISLDNQPQIQQIILINDNIKMWDQAIQVILDYMPTKLKIPFHKPKPQQTQLFKLGLNEFINALQKANETINTPIKDTKMEQRRTAPTIDIQRSDRKHFVQCVLQELGINDSKWEWHQNTKYENVLK